MMTSVYLMSFIEIIGHILIVLFTILFLLSLLGLVILTFMYLGGAFRPRIYKYDYYTNNQKKVLSIEAHDEESADRLALEFKIKNNLENIYPHIESYQIKSK